ncbi:hypothetical protein ACFL6S_29985, partial [Candidatus Poribacteria bacterium]
LLRYARNDRLRMLPMSLRAKRSNLKIPVFWIMIQPNKTSTTNLPSAWASETEETAAWCIFAAGHGIGG